MKRIILEIVAITLIIFSLFKFDNSEMMNLLTRGKGSFMFNIENRGFSTTVIVIIITVIVILSIIKVKEQTKKYTEEIIGLIYCLVMYFFIAKTRLPVSGFLIDYFTPISAFIAGIYLILTNFK